MSCSRRRRRISSRRRRFRDESMAFAPSVTIKDYTYGGSAGYPNPKKDGTPARFASVIQIVPAPR